MITLTRLNGKPFTLNALFIETIESFPDTTITLSNGHKYVVLEKSDQVEQKIVQFYRTINMFGINSKEVTDDEE